MTDPARDLTAWWTLELQQEINQWVLLGLVLILVAGIFVGAFEKRGK